MSKTQVIGPDNKPDQMFPNPNIASTSFGFGIEAEYLIIDCLTGEPKWHGDLKFELLNELIESIEFSDLGGDASVLETEAPHRKQMPFVVEGYHIPASETQQGTIKPKGLEIRTPLYTNISECIHSLEALRLRLQQSLKPLGLGLVALSHHPIESEFDGPMNKRRYDFWLWAKEVMTTYGPDINISVPSSWLVNFDLRDFEKKINYYGPAITALTLGSPFFKGKPWIVEDGSVGKSFRTYKRSIFAPSVEYHPDEANRFEFKSCEMSPNLKDFEWMTLLFLTLIRDNALLGRATKTERIYKLGEVAQSGLEARGIKERLAELLIVAEDLLPSEQFSIESLKVVKKKIESSTVLSDEILQLYKHEGEDLKSTLRQLYFQNGGIVD